MSRRRAAAALVVGLGLCACGSKDLPAANDETTGAGTGAVGTSSGSGSTTADTGGDTETTPEDRATIVHSFGVVDLAPLEETQPCVQWTLDN